MTVDARRKYLKVMKKRYRKAGRKERGQLLDETETGMHRKSLIRLLEGSLGRKPCSKQLGRTQWAEVEDALRVIAEVYGDLCLERLAHNLGWMVSHLNKHDEMEVTSVLEEKLEQVGTATVGRIESNSGSSRTALIRMEKLAGKTPSDGRNEDEFDISKIVCYGLSNSVKESGQGYYVEAHQAFRFVGAYSVSFTTASYPRSFAYSTALDVNLVNLDGAVHYARSITTNTATEETLRPKVVNIVCSTQHSA